MRVARKSGMMWHFAELPNCGWAQNFASEGSFDEVMTVSSVDELDEFCSLCREQRRR